MLYPKKVDGPARKQDRRTFLAEVAKLAGATGLASFHPSWGLSEQATGIVAPEGEAAFSSVSQDLVAGWLSPSRSYRPHTRWWWPGNAVTKDGIAWELDQMLQQGMGGVEIMSPWRMYAKGNIQYLSPEFVEMVGYAIEQAELRDMEVAITFCPGWKFGGFWVPPTHRSKVLTQSSVEVSGPGTFDQELPQYKYPPNRQPFHSTAPDENEIVAVVAGKVSGDKLDADSLVDLTSKVEKNHLRWQIPSGKWRLMAFRLKYTGDQCATTQNFPRLQWVVNHLSKEAMRSYCDYLGGTYFQAFGDQFGKTLDTFFCDSFEIAVLPHTFLWSNAALEQFKAYKGYDLARYLPAVWWDIGKLTPKVRYDVNDFLSWLGLDATFMTFINWCARHNAQARIQPYFSFPNEMIQGAGMTPRPEMEVTTDRFEVVLNPRKAVAAGAHLYGHKIVSAEAYTFLHMKRYRSTLEQLKGASDAFLRDGVTQFYNHGYIYSPEMHVAPSRDVPWANRISHWNVWWKYYHHLADYVSRCCYLLRQGEFAGDVLLYSPQATQWTQQVRHSNFVPYGDLGKTLVANGYDFDPVNDDVLQNRAHVENGQIKVRDLSYRFLIMPGTSAVPLATMEFIRKFALGGGVVIALLELPSASVGLKNSAQRDARVKQIVAELFGPNGKGRDLPGGGRTYFLADYLLKHKKHGDIFTKNESEPTALTPPQRALLAALREHLAPDFELAGNRQSTGLTFLHRRLGPDDVYFVTNLQPKTSDTSVTFRVPGKTPERWDPMTGKIHQVFVYQAHANGVEIPIRLGPWASTIFIFRSRKPPLHLSDANLEIQELNDHEVKGIADRNGEAHVTVINKGRSKISKAAVSGLPEPLAVKGTWRMVLEGYGFETFEKQVSALQSWTSDPRTEHFSGTGRYDLDFQVPDRYVRNDLEAVLDLGAVGNIAEVTLNGKAVGVAWMQPYRLNVTVALKSGMNHLEIRVTNTLINYVAGLKDLPPVPKNLVPHYGYQFDLYTRGAEEWNRPGRREKGFHPLPPSGLIGPVRLISRQSIVMEF